ncbi:twin-arginine translocation signal domain-containing protein [Falsiroseomonas selenitidurans]|uniref:Twin-arginine translocation signal domain-containing protein n=1 Tax=Falsiroseomonas selenitidurans TaxID=2716335 RepID=A0ABX1DY38_9PROT|nr:twin-arginine translocation signal domain-containing protein [Falsiroseomonas selenitidurans]NKC29781.1 twin-arginine translocation signal domain-containing protein [Falsiroseomonas selenitidurans]
MSEQGTERPVRRGFLKAIGLGAAVATPALAQRADSVPAGEARKENQAQRVAARYKADSADVQAFYRTNRYE